MAALLSQNTCIGSLHLTFNSFSTFTIHTSSQVAEHMARYSASPVDLETVDCFLLFHETRFSPKNMQKPVTDLRVSTHLAQSESA
ncbi:hypothetical protein Hdeb2414_s0010g00339091 [Helianthus debilis subsp. tardiflorus]